VNRAAKAARVGEILEGLYPDPVGPLTGGRQDAYQLLIKVLLSAQCTDVRVNQVAPRLFERASTPAQMVELRVSTIEDVVRPCGLGPAKSKAIHGLSRQLLADHGGRVPRTFAELEALPGVGHKTASVVAGQAFGLPAFPVDTHIHRLAARWGLSRARNVVQTERDLKRLWQQADWHKRHLQIIFFGREYCPARGHDLSDCPICSWAATKKRASQERGRR